MMFLDVIRFVYEIFKVRVQRQQYVDEEFKTTTSVKMAKINLESLFSFPSGIFGIVCHLDASVPHLFFLLHHPRFPFPFRV